MSCKRCSSPGPQGAAAPGLLGLSRCPPPPGDTPRTPRPPQAGSLGLPHLLGASFVRFAVGRFPSEADLAFPKPKSPSHIADRPDPGLLGFHAQLSQQWCPRVRVRLRGLPVGPPAFPDFPLASRGAVCCVLGRQGSALRGGGRPRLGGFRGPRGSSGVIVPGRPSSPRFPGR